MCYRKTTRNYNLKIYTIDKSNKPSSFKRTEAKILPDHYYNQHKDWTVKEIILKFSLQK